MASAPTSLVYRLTLLGLAGSGKSAFANGVIGNGHVPSYDRTRDPTSYLVRVDRDKQRDAAELQALKDRLVAEEKQSREREERRREMKKEGRNPRDIDNLEPLPLRKLRHKRHRRRERRMKKLKRMVDATMIGGIYPFPPRSFGVELMDMPGTRTASIEDGTPEDRATRFIAVSNPKAFNRDPIGTDDAPLGADAEGRATIPILSEAERLRRLKMKRRDMTKEDMENLDTNNRNELARARKTQGFVIFLDVSNPDSFHKARHILDRIRPIAAVRAKAGDRETRSRTPSQMMAAQASQALLARRKQEERRDKDRARQSLVAAMRDIQSRRGSADSTDPDAATPSKPGADRFMARTRWRMGMLAAKTGIVEDTPAVRTVSGDTDMPNSSSDSDGTDFEFRGSRPASPEQTPAAGRFASVRGLSRKFRLSSSPVNDPPVAAVDEHGIRRMDLATSPRPGSSPTEVEPEKRMAALQLDPPVATQSPSSKHTMSMDLATPTGKDAKGSGKKSRRWRTVVQKASKKKAHEPQDSMSSTDTRGSGSRGRSRAASAAESTGSGHSRGDSTASNFSGISSPSDRTHSVALSRISSIGSLSSQDSLDRALSPTAAARAAAAARPLDSSELGARLLSGLDPTELALSPPRSSTSPEASQHFRGQSAQSLTSDPSEDGLSPRSAMESMAQASVVSGISMTPSTQRAVMASANAATPVRPRERERISFLVPILVIANKLDKLSPHDPYVNKVIRAAEVMSDARPNVLFAFGSVAHDDLYLVSYDRNNSGEVVRKSMTELLADVCLLIDSSKEERVRLASKLREQSELLHARVAEDEARDPIRSAADYIPVEDDTEPPTQPNEDSGLFSSVLSWLPFGGKEAAMEEDLDVTADDDVDSEIE